MGHEEGEVLLAKGEGGECLSGLWGAEDELDKGDDGNECEEVEEDCQHVEEQVGGDVPGIELGVAKDPPDVVHGSMCIGLLTLKGDDEW